MFFLEYIPDTIDPLMRKIIIGLVSVQVLSFFLYIFMLISDHKKAKLAKNKEENNEINGSEIESNNKDKLIEENKDEESKKEV